MTAGCDSTFSLAAWRLVVYLASLSPLMPVRPVGGRRDTTEKTTFSNRFLMTILNLQSIRNKNSTSLRTNHKLTICGILNTDTKINFIDN